MGLAQPEDFIAKQGTNGLRLWIDLTNIINDQGMKIATLEHAVQQMKQLLQKSDTSKELVQIKKAREICETYILSVPVLMDTPELALMILQIPNHMLAAYQLCILAAMLTQQGHCPSSVLLIELIATCQLVAATLHVLLTAVATANSSVLAFFMFFMEYSLSAKNSHSRLSNSAWFQPLLGVGGLSAGGLSLEGSGGAFKAPSPKGADPKPRPEGVVGVPTKLLLLV